MVARRRLILDLRESGRTFKYIAQQFNMSVEGVRLACKRAAWEQKLQKDTQAIFQKRVSPDQVRIDEITMSVRAFNTLNMLGVIYISEIPEFTQREVLSIRGAGWKTLVEIEDQILKPFGLKLYSDA